ncbi:hypothetical protein M9H77_04237 [Catharanthus roseus]|uniref:Uncharacterized protein n=1 Tax=Catharanthus roseus TaxID=4058 RepID=A0ACC0CDZ3_CATRO|nr:hypothetical protein M9H77_04237 [Catharanthus roseus]
MVSWERIGLFDQYPGLKFGENQVNGCVSGLYCTWLVPRTRVSYDDVDGFSTLRVDPLEEGRSIWRAWPNRYLRGHRIILCGGTTAFGRARRGLKFSAERHEGMLVGWPSRTTSSSSYSLREIVPERDPVLVIDLLDSESIEGLVSQDLEFRVSIEEDPSEA